MRSELVAACAHGLKSQQIKGAKKHLPEGEEFEVFGYLKVYGSGKMSKGSESVQTQKYTTLAVMARMLQELGISHKRVKAAYEEACRCVNEAAIDENSSMKKIMKEVLEGQPVTERAGACTMNVNLEEITRDDMVSELMALDSEKLKIAA